MHLALKSLLGSLLIGWCQGASWTGLAPIPVAPRQEHITVAVSSTTLAILGGIIPVGNGYNTTDIMQLYDIPTNKWRSAAPIPVPLNHPNAAAVDGKIYLLGGLVVAPDGAWRAVPNSWVYDPATDAWKELDPMPTVPRGSSAIGVYKKTIYLAGGMTVLVPGPGGEQGSVVAVSALDTASGKWTTLPAAAQQIPERRDHVGGAVVGRSFYVLGGRDRGQVNVRDTVFMLDLEKQDGGWITKAGKMPTPRGGVAAAAVGSKVYTFGGEGNPAAGTSGVFNETEVYDTTTDTWEKLQPMALPRHGTSAVAIGNTIFIPGGGIAQGAGPVATLDAFNPSLLF
jgi:N-acetylneuraminic acid mutarotase